jgi:hypothetical protein
VNASTPEKRLRVVFAVRKRAWETSFEMSSKDYYSIVNRQQGRHPVRVTVSLEEIRENL